LKNKKILRTVVRLRGNGQEKAGMTLRCKCSAFGMTALIAIMPAK